jgi:hypothetical protein
MKRKALSYKTFEIDTTAEIPEPLLVAPKVLMIKPLSMPGKNQM